MRHLKPITKAVAVGVGALLLSQLAWSASITSSPANGPVHPIVDVARGYVLGGSAGGKWLDLKAIAPSIPAQQSYRVYGLGGYIGTGIGPKPASEGAPCDETLFSHLKPTAKGTTFDDHALAFAGDWNPRPRRVRLLKTNNPIYRRLVAQMLRQHGLRSPAQITQLMQVDLDGSGEPAMLIVGQRYTATEAPPGGISFKALAGDYAFVWLRRMRQGKLQTQFLESEFHRTISQAPNFFRIANVLDLNGDGKMEVVVRGQYYEGDWTSVYSETKGEFKEVLSSGCGA